MFWNNSKFFIHDKIGFVKGKEGLRKLLINYVKEIGFLKMISSDKMHF